MGTHFQLVRFYPSLARASARRGDGIRHLVPAALVLGSIFTAATLGVAECLPPPENQFHDVVFIQIGCFVEHFSNIPLNYIQ